MNENRPVYLNMHQICSLWLWPTPCPILGWRCIPERTSGFGKHSLRFVPFFRLPPPTMTLAGASRRRRASCSHPPLPLIAIVLLLVFPPPPRTYALRIPLREVASLLSLSHSLLARVAVARADRGDAAAAARARRIASHLSLLSSRCAWALGWDYLRHYAFSSVTGCGFSCATAAARLLAAAAEASRLKSPVDAAQWLRRNYGDLLAAATQLLNGLLSAFSEQVHDLVFFFL